LRGKQFGSPFGFNRGSYYPLGREIKPLLYTLSIAIRTQKKEVSGLTARLGSIGRNNLD
jgi:hypothetical protein